jgi:hypothetical protein
MTLVEGPNPDAVDSADTSAPTTPWAHWVWWVAFGVLSVGFVSIAADAPLHFDGLPIEGPFQLSNALRRLAAGQRLAEHSSSFMDPESRISI